jgi:hypothetical protein
MADLIPPMLIKLQADVQDLKVGLAQAESAIKGVDKSVQTASTGMTNFATKVKQIGASLGIAFAGTQVLQFGRDVIQQAQEAEAQQQRLYQLMKVGTGATDEQIASLNAQAEALQKVGVVTAGNITQTQSQLATFNLQTDTIKALTPAILDYVTAEKGASAGADEFKQMTNGLAQALNGNFGSLTRVGFVLDENTKKQISSGTEAQRAAAIVEVLNSTYKDFNAELRNTPEGRMQVLRNDFDQLKEDLGKKLLPALKIVTDFLTDQLIPGLRTLGKFFKDNSTIILTVTGAVLAGVVAWKAYQTILIVTSAVTKAYTTIQTVMRTGTLVSIASTNGLAASMLKLNAVMRANPIGVIVTAIALLVAGFVIAYKKSETFRNGVAIVAKAVLGYVAFMIRAWGDFITILMKVITGPLKLFLGIMSKLPGVGNAAKQGLKLVNGAIEGVGNFAEKTAKKIEGLKSKVDSFTAAANKAAKAGKDVKDKVGDGGGTGGDSGGGSDLSKEEKARLKKLEGYKEKVVGIYEDMNQVILNAQEKAQEALETRNEKMLEAHQRYDEEVFNLNERYRETIANAEEAYAEKVADIKTRKQEADIAAQERYEETLANIEENYIAKKLDLQETYENKVTDLKASAAEKTADLLKNANEKQLSIVQQSIDRLRNAFASKTGFSIAESFSGGAQNADKLIADLKGKLEAIKNLQANAAQLAGLGYSQVFIEEIVKQGPEAGNKIAEALKAASPDATKELQSLYGQVEDVSNNGLDALAQSMNSGGKLATQELMNAYKQVSVDLGESLAKTNEDLTKNLADAQTAFNKAMTDNEAARTDALDKASAQLQKALADNLKTFEKAMADAAEVLDKARIKAQEDLNKGLLQAQNQLAASLAKAQKDYEDSITKINEDTQKKLDALQKKLEDAKKKMDELNGDTSGIYTNAPVYTPIIPVTSPANSAVNSTATTTTNINQVFSNATVDPSDVHLAVVSAVKYGAAVTVAPTVKPVPKSFMSVGAYDRL